MSAIADNLARVQERIAAAERSGGRVDEITLVAVTKKQSASSLREAQAAGITDVGENYVQETVQKKELWGPLSEQSVRWHLIGHLQSNKAALAVTLFDLIQSVDSVKLAAALSKHAQIAGKTQSILLQVHLGDEPTKTGVPPEQALDVAEEIAGLPGVALHGLMGIAPFGMEARPYFQELRRLFASLPSASQRVLSMGMSSDFETAIEEGATMVRVGTAIFGTRNS